MADYQALLAAATGAFLAVHRGARWACLSAVSLLPIAFGCVGVSEAEDPSGDGDDGSVGADSGGQAGTDDGAAGSSESAGTSGLAGATSSTEASGEGGNEPSSVSGSTGGGEADGTGGAPATPVTSGTGGYEPVDVDMPYTDDFEDGDTAGWMVWNKSDSSPGFWAIGADGSNSVLQQTGSGSSDTWDVAGSVHWTDQSLQVKVRFADTDTRIYLAVRFASTESYYYLQLDPGSKPKIRLRHDGGTNDVASGESDFEPTAGTWYTVVVTAQGPTFTASIDGTTVCTGTNSTVPSGGIALGTDGGQAAFDDVSVTAP